MSFLQNKILYRQSSLGGKETELKLMANLCWPQEARESLKQIESESILAEILFKGLDRSIVLGFFGKIQAHTMF